MSMISRIIECARVALELMQESLGIARLRREVLLSRLGDFNSTWHSLNMEQKYRLVSDIKGLQQVRRYDEAVYFYCLSFCTQTPGQPNYHALRQGISILDSDGARVLAVDKYVAKVNSAILQR